MSPRLITLVCFVGAAAVPCSGQSINIDFGNGNGGPPADYAGAGLPGTWNVLTGPVDTLTALVGLDGAPTTASIRVVNGSGTLPGIPVQHPALGDDRPLMDDGMLGAGGPKITVDIDFFGLEPGLYRLITYTWYWPAEEFAQAVFVNGSPVVHPAGGPWSGGLAVGVTHMEHIVAVAAETLAVPADLSLFVVGDGPGSFWNGAIFINGIQLWKIDEPPPCAADIDGDGVVGITELLAVLGVWGACPGCPEDFDGDGVVGITDLLILLAGWGSCPGTSPASCGDTGLGDCYSVHASPGCDEPACCAALCAFDPYCCDVAWDQLCVGIANLAADCTESAHPNCGNAEAGPCTEPSTVPGCDDSDCCKTICDRDPFCCNYAWSAYCVSQAELFCSEIPPQCGHPASGDCFDAIGEGQNVTPYCNDEACCDSVCLLNPLCCDVVWDETCVARANAVCDGGACGPGAGPCHGTHSGGGCNDTDCCFQVCSIVPTCCEPADPKTGLGGWDSNCVAWTELLCVD